MITKEAGKLRRVVPIVTTVAKVMGLLLCLYFFICSLSFLSDSFRILGGRNIGSLFTNSELLKNPVIGVMIGVLVTVLVQSSSTSTSIIVGLVSAGAPVKEAVPMIMGANIGTSVTNIIVALTQAGDREQFRRAFACANVHDMFNWLSAFILLIVEVLTGYLETVTGLMVAAMHGEAVEGEEMAEVKPKTPDFLKILTKPFTERVIQLDKQILKGWATNDPKYENSTSILKSGCLQRAIHTNHSQDDSLQQGSYLHDSLHPDSLVGGSLPSQSSCYYLFSELGPEGLNLKEGVIGVMLLAISLVMLCVCLLMMVKLLNLLLGPQVKSVIENVINADIPIQGLAWLTGYLAMGLGAILTILVQSSSVFTSTLTPLAGAGLISLERAYPMTLGSNLGTTTTSLLASFAAGGHHVKEANQIALVHLMFNLTGICIFYPIPWMRLPVKIARVLGRTTSQYRWFAVVYLAFMFFLLPGTIFALSLAGPVTLYAVLVPAFTTLVFVLVVNAMKERGMRDWLPQVLHTWDFLPECLRSMDFWDRHIMQCLGCCSCCCFCCPAPGGASVGSPLEGAVIHLPGSDEAVLLPRGMMHHHGDDTPPDLAFPNVAYNRLPVVPSSASLTDIKIDRGRSYRPVSDREARAQSNRRRYMSTSIF